MVSVSMFGAVKFRGLIISVNHLLKIADILTVGNMIKRRVPFSLIKIITVDEYKDI